MYFRALTLIKYSCLSRINFYVKCKLSHSGIEFTMLILRRNIQTLPTIITTKGTLVCVTLRVRYYRTLMSSCRHEPSSLLQNQSVIRESSHAWKFDRERHGLFSTKKPWRNEKQSLIICDRFRFESRGCCVPSASSTES